MSFREAFTKTVQAVKEAMTLPALDGWQQQPKPIPVRVTSDTQYHRRPHRPQHW